MDIMLDFQQKRKVRAFIYHRATLIALLILVVVVFHSTWVVFNKKKESEEMKYVASNNVAELNARNNGLQDKIDRLGTDQGVEEEIRSKFNVAKANENVVIVVDDPLDDLNATGTPGFWKKIWHFFHK